MPNVLLEALGLDLLRIGSNISGIRDILQYEELMFDSMDEKAVGAKILQALSDVTLRRLCTERKKVFLFNWKERVFQMVTESTEHGESSPADRGYLR